MIYQYTRIRQRLLGKDLLTSSLVLGERDSIKREIEYTYGLSTTITGSEAKSILIHALK